MRKISVANNAEMSSKRDKQQERGAQDVFKEARDSGMESTRRTADHSARAQPWGP